MKYHISEAPGFSLATVTATNLKTVTAYISIDLHTSQTASLRAAELLYTDALISGAGKFSRVEFLNAINLLGATLSASISDGVLTIFVRSSAEVFKKVLSLVETMLLEPHFDSAELKRIKQTVTNALKESRENSRAIAHEQLRNALYGPHDRRYTFSDETLINEIAKSTPKELRAIHKKVCTLPWTCSIAANKEVVDVFKRSLSKVKGKYPEKAGEFGIHEQLTPAPTVVLKNIPSRQNIDFSIGAPVPITLHHPDYIPLVFALSVLGKWGGFTGRLMSTVREQEGLTYGIYAQAETFSNEEQGYWRIMTFFAPDKALKGLTSTFREIKKLYAHGITDFELDQFKQILNTAQVLKNDSTASLLNELHAYHLQKFSLAEIAEHKKRIFSVTKADVNNAIQHYLNPAHITVSGAGPTASVKKELQSFLKSVS
jgi:predicted Zn-dependent peptidase